MARRGRLHKGWMRAWVVSSVIITLASLVLIYPHKKNQSDTQPSGFMLADVKSYDHEKAIINGFFDRPARFLSDEMRDCDREEAYLTPMYENRENPPMLVTCPRNELRKILRPLGVAACLSALLFLLGVIGAWIKNGFKEPLGGG